MNSHFRFLEKEKENRVFAIDVFLEKSFFFFFFLAVWLSGGVCEGLVGPWLHGSAWASQNTAVLFLPPAAAPPLLTSDRIPAFNFVRFSEFLWPTKCNRYLYLNLLLAIKMVLMLVVISTWWFCILTWKMALDSELSAGSKPYWETWLEGQSGAENLKFIC